MKTVCLDFDGTLNTYDGWRGPGELFEPRPGLEDFLRALRSDDYELVVLSTREKALIESWLSCHGLNHYISRVVREKPPAVVYLDDRGITFTGDYAAALAAIRRFRAYWEH